MVGFICTQVLIRKVNGDEDIGLPRFLINMIELNIFCLGLEWLMLSLINLIKKLLVDLFIYITHAI